MANWIRKKGMVDMQNMLAQFCMQQLGFGPVGNIHMLLKSGQNSYNYFRSRIDDANWHTQNSKGEAALTTKRNDVLLVAPSSHTWYGDSDVEGAALTWDKQNTHLLGMGPVSKSGYGRCRFGHSGKTMANFMTVSGHYNVFKNLRWMHGASTGGASDVTCLTVTGAGNLFDGCNFAGPMNATQAASANYIGVDINGATSSHFRDCLFGTHNAVDRNGASCMLRLRGGGGLNIFENCIFRSHSTANAFFISWSNTEQAGVGAVFLNCQFINVKAAAEGDMTYAINANSQHANDFLYFDNRCSFVGVGDVIAAGSESKVLVGGQTYSAAATSNLLNATADYS